MLIFPFTKTFFKRSRNYTFPSLRPLSQKCKVRGTESFRWRHLSGQRVSSNAEDVRASLHVYIGWSGWQAFRLESQISALNGLILDTWRLRYWTERTQIRIRLRRFGYHMEACHWPAAEMESALWQGKGLFHAALTCTDVEETFKRVSLQKKSFWPY